MFSHCIALLCLSEPLIMYLTYHILKVDLDLSGILNLLVFCCLSYLYGFYWRISIKFHHFCTGCIIYIVYASYIYRGKRKGTQSMYMHIECFRFAIIVMNIKNCNMRYIYIFLIMESILVLNVAQTNAFIK